MHFLVTGGAGFIGSHLTEQLLAEGHNVTVLDDLSTGNLKNLPEHPHLNIIQKNVLACQPEDFHLKIDGIAHLAATPSVTQSWMEPLSAHHNNLSATVAVIELCQALKIPKLVFASSAAVYGDKIPKSISEEQPPNPISPYGLQKLVSEQYADLFTKQFELSFIGLRLFNVFGPRQVPGSQYSGVISIFVSAMQQGKQITIYGDGSQTRDFVFVKDVANAFAKSLTTPTAPGAISCNIGTGKSTSLLQLVNIMKTFYPQWQLEPSFAPPRPGDILHSQADISKASSVLNFIPQWSVESGLQNLVEWQKLNEKSTVKI
ncbi:NAD-dependent epimerase/dehydratase family protein [Iningainema tapete]|uniref:NAD-dependent epimerase/dehydratase family protein n=1 Tax=Iningainema tapete BLCC-T55 TaxID=2748662 RepID=A0A8J7C6L0_9CYAN|nr:NAD-dependent epimerase/dehydratase family protein [Iningainema tapete]MBD2774464.1 NAD-dependent epimerase/dehydratase family protein [Iningainema tapete BLCC-T55]